MQRKNWIDWAKALGILLVVMGHSNYAIGNMIPMIFMIHMPLFFVASGYLFKTNKSLREMTVSNVRTLLIPYLLFNLISLLYYSAVCGVKQITLGGADWHATVVIPLLNVIAGIPGNLLCGPTWFLLALVWCKYIVYGIERGNAAVKYSILVVWTLSFVLVQIFQPHSPLSFNAGVAGCVWFAIGYYIRKAAEIKDIKINKLTWVVAIPIGFVICLYICRLQGNCNYIGGNVNGWLGFLGTAAGLISYYGLCKLLDGVHSKLVICVSSASIVVMCLHMLLMPVLEKLTHYQGHLGITLLGDLAIVLLLTSIYPLIRKYFPVLIGNRK